VTAIPTCSSVIVRRGARVSATDMRLAALTRLASEGAKIANDVRNGDPVSSFTMVPR
jgi:hypothetical protein